MKHLPRNNQRGAALMVGLMILTVVTLVALSSMKNTNTQQTLAGNMQQRMLVYQAAESLIRVVVNTVNRPGAPMGGGDHPLVAAISNAMDTDPDTVAPAFPLPNLDGAPPPADPGVPAPAAEIQGVGTLTYLGSTNAPGYSIGQGASGVYVAHRFQINSVVNMTTENTQDTHLQGLKRIAPAP